MKNKLITLILASILILAAGCGDKEQVLEDIPVSSDYVQFDYKGLKQEAMIIAKIQVLDNLSTDNTEITYDPYDEADNSIIGFLGIRKVKILELYKGTGISIGDELEMLEPAGVTDTQILRTEGYQPMARDGIYIVFLSNNTASGRFGIISANNGIVNLSSPESSPYPEIALKSIIEYESNLPAEEIAALLEADLETLDKNQIYSYID